MCYYICNYIYTSIQHDFQSGDDLHYLLQDHNPPTESNQWSLDNIRP